ncbi:MAG: hydroxyethylthiazole kinase [Candidatus Omnitrophica bacterium]|nr:hydroxyethylthiazole kinase [Candidatus Omnitrophota bacterium]MBU1127791.1 hydroxyethylthiazole kinase [Candidatus Omnitrophota bacterium]MBU1656690.1 hydroxyethylthiazole kinase [Candidatus Omnitrophota bacterium]MBU1784652.1 hydroxyethylthiazole kinase [Candidatus Omnitrophota bacterium]MBU1852264.1 hydroxyethylthiazole kinase [Candidatus Omnitrophota bacterium]
MEIYKLLEKVRRDRPIIHYITNLVTMNDCASLVKILGGFPLMTHAREEAETMTKYSSALVLDIGTLEARVAEAMKSSAVVANSMGIPVILDICGVGASRFRDDKAMEIAAETRIDLIKGNIREIAKFSGKQIRLKSIDPVMVLGRAVELAVGFSKQRKCTVVIAGNPSVVAGAGKHFVVKNGHDMLSQVVGAGSMGTAVIGAFAAVEKDLALAAVAGLCCYRIAAELAAAESRGPAVFKMNMLDNLYQLTEDQIEKMRRIE